MSTFMVYCLTLLVCIFASVKLNRMTQISQVVNYHVRLSYRSGANDGKVLKDI